MNILIPNDDIRDIIVKSHKEAGIDLDELLKNNDAAFAILAGHPTWTILVYIHQYCCLCTMMPEKVKGMNHRQIAFFNLKDGLEHRWSENLYNHAGKLFLSNVEKNILTTDGFEKYNVLEQYTMCVRMMALLESLYDENPELSAKITRDGIKTTDSEVGAMIAVREEVTKAINELDGNEEYLFADLLEEIWESPMNKQLDDVCFYLMKNYQAYIGDERVTELFNMIDGGDIEE